MASCAGDDPGSSRSPAESPSGEPPAWPNPVLDKSLVSLAENLLVTELEVAASDTDHTPVLRCCDPKVLRVISAASSF